MTEGGVGGVVQVQVASKDVGLTVSQEDTVQELQGGVAVTVEQQAFLHCWQHPGAG